MRVLVVGMGWLPESPGGLNRYAFDLVDALSQRGLEAKAIVVGSPPPGHSFVGVAESGAPLLRRLWRAGLEGRARAGVADLIDGHFALYTLPVLWSRPRKPLVVHFQGPWHREAAIASNQPRRLIGLRRQIEAYVYRRAAEVIVLSEAFQHLAISDFGVLPGRVHVIRPGVDLDRFRLDDPIKSRVRLGLSPDQRMVLSVRRLTKRVGLDVLLHAWARSTTGDASLYIVGDGPERDRLAALANQLGIRSTVHLTGPVSDAELPLWYSAADVSIVPSVVLEGFGLVVLESLAAGTPVIASDTGGMAEILPKLASGLLVPPNDPSTLARQISSALIGDLTLPSRTDCRRFAENFSWTKAAGEVVEIFEQARSRPPVRRFRIVFLDHCAKLSGGELAMLRMLKGAQAIEAHVILAQDGPLVKELEKANISTEVFPLPKAVSDLSRAELRSPATMVRANVAIARYAYRLALRLRQLRPDIVHTNSLKSGLYGSVAGHLARIPVVWHLRDRLSSDNYPQPQAALIGRCVKWMPNAIIANSRATAELLGRSRVPLWVIPSPVDIEPALYPKHGPPTVGIVGRLAPWKGQDIFLEAVAKVRKEHSSLRARVIGSPLFGEEHYYQTLKRRASELGIAEIVQFTGFRQDIAAELSRLTIAVHASVVPEPFGQVVVESMACGVPIIATAAGGPAEIVSPGTDGLLVPPGDAAAMAEAIATLLQDGALRTRLAEAGALKAQRYRPEPIARQVEALYASVVRTRS